MSKWIAGLVVIFNVGAAVAAPTKVTLQYSTKVPRDQSERLNKDLLLLNSLKFKDSDGDVQHFFQVPIANNENMKKWLAERAHVVVDPKHPLNDSTITVIQEDVTFPYPDETPKFAVNEAPLQKDPQEPALLAKEDDQQGSVQIVMSNIGGLVYMGGKQNHSLIGLNVEGVGLVPARSPHVGIFRIGPGLFQPLSKKYRTKDVQNRLHSIFRLSTLFHESRHGDSHGKTMLFPHALCPEGHDYAGNNACDTPSNGPYRIESVFLRSLRDGCVDCSKTETEVMNILILDAESRVLTPLKAGENSPAQKGTKTLCDDMIKMEIKADFCEAAEKPSKEVVEWDADPEKL